MTLVKTSYHRVRIGETFLSGSKMYVKADDGDDGAMYCKPDGSFDKRHFPEDTMVELMVFEVREYER